MRVGIITYHNAYSYGAQLQAYALQEVVAALGHEVKIIDYKGVGFDAPSIVDFKVALRRPWRFVNVLNKHRSKCAFLTFRDKQRLSGYYGDYKSLVESPPAFDAYICGSDQVWQPKKLSDGRLFQDEYFLSFVRTGARRIAYAPSFGTMPTEEYVELISPELKKFDSVSVREKGMADVVGRILGHDVPIVCDPTILLGRAGFDELLAEDGQPAHSPVRGRALYYPLSFQALRDKNIARRVAVKCGGIEIVSRRPPVMGIGKNVIPTPIEWIRKIRDAEFVLTNSFHGTVFSILYHKRFMTLGWSEERFNERIRFLLGRLGIEGRYYNGSSADEFEQLAAKEIDWACVDEVLARWRRQSREFLSQALG